MKKLILSSFLWEYDDMLMSVLQTMVYQYRDQFDIYKLEKDFYLTVLLIDFGRNFPELIFKWWTCLNKIYYNYYRLSEDLDFVIIQDGSRNKRKDTLEYYKQAFMSSRYSDLWLRYVDKRTKFNEDQQWCFIFEYDSLFDNSLQTIKIDIRIEPYLLLEPIIKPIWSIFINPIYKGPFFDNHTIKVMDLNEVMAEKMRAALTRDPFAIRDFFDIWYAREQGFDFDVIKELISKKVWDLQYTVPESINILKPKILSELNPVLSKQNREQFDINDIYQFIIWYKS